MSNIFISDKIKKNNFHLKYKPNSILTIKDNCNISGLNVFLGDFSKLFIEENCSINGEIRVGYKSSVYIGKNTTIASNISITAYEMSEVFIGEDCMFSHNCIVRASDGHYIYDEYGNRINPSKSIKIENHVWFGLNSIVLKGVNVGTGSVIGIGTIVTHDIPASSVAVGNPAKVVKTGIKWSR